MAAAQVEQDHRQTPKCTDYPDFAVICSFLSEFSETCGLDPVPIDQLEIMLEENENIYPYLMKMHIKLLRKILKSVQVDKWEKSLVKFGHTYNSQDAWEIERFGYKKAKVETKLRLLKNLLESQFDFNPKFKVEINKLEANKLRLAPLGRDHEGQNYWYQIDSDANVRVYREDADDESWNLVANDREQLITLISELQKGEVKRNVIKNYEGEAFENGIEEDDDENEIEISDILLDTGKPPSTSSEDSSSRDAFEKEEKEDSNSNQEIDIKSQVEETKLDIAQTNEIEELKSEENETNIQSSAGETEKETISPPELKPAELKECKEEKEKDLSKDIENKKQTLEEINSDSVGVDNKIKIKNDQINDKVPIIQEQEEKNLDLIKEKEKLKDNTAVTESHAKEDLISQHKEFSLKSEMLIKVTDEMPQDIFDDDESPKELCIDENEVVDSKPTKPAATKTTLKTLPPKENEKSKALKVDEKPEIKENVKDLESSQKQKPKAEPGEPTDKIDDSSKSKSESPVVAKKSIIAKSDKHTTEIKIEEIKSEPVIKEDMKSFKEISKSKLADADSGKKEKIVEQTKVEKVNESKEPSDFDKKDNHSISADKKIPSNKEKDKEKEKALSSLVGYEYSSSDDDELVIAEAELEPEKNTLKRKSSNELDGPTTKSSKIADNDNGIVGEAIEEELMIITGEGSGAQNETGNKNDADDSEEDSLDDSSEGESEAEAEVSENSDEPKAKPVGRGRGRGRGRPPSKSKGRGRGRGSAGRGASTNQSTETATATVSGSSGRGRGRGRGRKRKASSSNESQTPIVSLNSPPEESKDLEETHNGRRSSQRSSGRIAVLRVKEEEERRRLEGERLQQLKQAQLTKKQDKVSNKSNTAAAEDPITTPLKGKKRGRVKGSGSPMKKGVKFEKNYLPTPSGSDSDEVPEVLEKGKRGKKGKGKKGKKNGNGEHSLKWTPDDRSSDEHVDEEEEEEHLEDEEEETIDKSDHEFSPESDLDDEEGSKPSRHARTAKRGEEVDKYSETYCEKCTKGDHPEWILLCDSCDKGYHASCLRPQLWVIPEGSWFCPPCEHKSLVGKFDEYLVEFDKLLKKRENDELRKQRLAFVGISLENILPPVVAEEKKKQSDKNNKEKRSRNRRRRIDSDSADSLLDGGDDDENLGGFIVDHGENSSSFDELEESEVEDEPIYRLRERKASKGFSLKEYDELINNAIREDEDVLGEIQPGVPLPVDENEIVEGSGAPIPEKKKRIRTGKDIGNGETDSEEELDSEAEKKDSDDSDGVGDEDLNEGDEKENRMKELLKQDGTGTEKKARRKKRLNDLDDPEDDDDNDSDFLGEENDDDDDEEQPEDDESDWSGDKDDSDDSIVKSRRFEKTKKSRFGRRETYTESGSVRRSTRRRKAKVKYDDSDEDEDQEEKASGEDNWDSEKEDAPEESGSQSSDSDWGKRKKKKAPPPPKIRHSLAKFVMDPSKKRSFGKGGKKKRKRVDEENVDRAYCNNIGSKAKAKLAEQPVERKTRGKLINFKDILDSSESDNDGKIKSKRRRISSESEEEGENELKIDEDQQPSSSTKLTDSNHKVATTTEVGEENLESQPPILEPQSIIPTATILEEKDIIIPPQMQEPPALFPASTSPNKNSKKKTINNKKDQLSTTTPILSKQLVDEIAKPEENPIPVPADNIIRIPSPKKEKKDKKSKKSNQQKQLADQLPVPPPLVPNPNTSNIQHLPSNSSPLISHTPHSMPSNPHYQNQPIRPPFHPSWVRPGPGGPQPPPYSGPGPQQSIPGHPGHSAFMQMSQQMIRSGYPPPRPNDLRMNIFPHYRPNQTPPSQQHPHQMYNRYPSQQQMMGGPPPNMNPYPYHFGVPPQGPPPVSHSSPPQTQSQPPQPIFSNPPYEFSSRIGMEEGQHTSTPPPTSVSSISQKTEPQNPSEFGGLVSYFSSQRSDDLDS